MRSRPRRVGWRRLSTATVAVLAGHAAVLSMTSSPAASSVARPVLSKAVELRLVGPAAKEHFVETVLRTATPEARVSTTNASPRVAAQLDAGEPPASARETMSAALEAPPQALSPRPADAFEGDGPFETRDSLWVAPTLLGAVAVAYPEFPDDNGHYVCDLTLYIDESGAVLRVHVDGPPLPAPLEDSVRAAFLGARFAPGQVADGLHVRSKIRIEVRFGAAAS
jgi:hypothetical protein